MVDTGLLANLLLKDIQFNVLNGDVGVNEGALTENYVACSLSSKGIALHYYDKKAARNSTSSLRRTMRLLLLKSNRGRITNDMLH